jgi:hypothetical protein
MLASSFALLAGCSVKQLNDFTAQMEQNTPPTPIDYEYDEQVHHFMTRRTTYNDVVAEIGEPTKTAVRPEFDEAGYHYVTYRTSTDSRSGDPYHFTNYQAQPISDGVFKFDKNMVLLSAKIEDMSDNAIARSELAAYRATKTTQDGLLAKTNAEMALVAKEGHFRCGWPLSDGQMHKADDLINAYRPYTNSFDFNVFVQRGLARKGYMNNTDLCLDDEERKKFDKVAKMLAR